ncbi:ammonia-forming cytochrome c nitrite reductase subunit c552, partial [Vibrio parahaemolyticus]|nr:ammonia-forming cytochrome c nitrite reductase subunit c552 [Vibrio parahaemolyticus]
MSIKHWMSAPIAVATLFASQLLLAGSVLAAENNDRLDPRNDAFEQNHPDQYHSWKATSESKHIEDALSEDPNMVILWAGYGFAKDYNKA